jgi:hypothetical protein
LFLFAEQGAVAISGASRTMMTGHSEMDTSFYPQLISATWYKEHYFG